MKTAFLLICIFISASVVSAQATSSVVAVVTVYSQNEKFYLKSIPYDNKFPTLRGKTFVYEKGAATPLYVFERGFDSVDDESNNLILSNDGEVIFYAIPWGADEKKEGLKGVTIYKKGEIFKSFSEMEVTGCDKKKEQCSLIYSNYDEVVDKEKSHWGEKNYKKVLKKEVSEEERFLNNFAIFSFDDTVYLTDPKKQVHLFDLKEGNHIEAVSFENIFNRIKNKGRFNKIEITKYDLPVFLEFPKLKDGEDANKALAKHLGLKAASIFNNKDEQYKLYSFALTANISQDGSLEIESIEFHDDLPKEKIIEFFKANKFDIRPVPHLFDKWHVSDKFFYFRNPNNIIARREKRQAIIKAREERARRKTLETIEGVYIPKNLGECLTELDKILPEVAKKEMQALPERSDMIRYHTVLGMWMRNDWGLWGGSRLEKYFTDKGIRHPEAMSTIILFHYYDWLKGDKEKWKNWEKNPKRETL